MMGCYQIWAMGWRRRGCVLKSGRVIKYCREALKALVTPLIIIGNSTTQTNTQWAEGLDLGTAFTHHCVIQTGTTFQMTLVNVLSSGSKFLTESFYLHKYYSLNYSFQLYLNLIVLSNNRKLVKKYCNAVSTRLSITCSYWYSLRKSSWRWGLCI